MNDVCRRALVAVAMMLAAVTGAWAQAADSETESLRLRIFSDASARTASEDGTGTFSVGGIDFFATSRPSPRVTLLAEVLFEPGADNAFVIDAERLMAEYRLAEQLTLGGGRFHTSIGYYNTAFHHGTYFETAIGRPAVFSFEDDAGPLPIHGVGAWIRGLFSTPRLGVRYVVEMSNGRPADRDVEHIQNVQDEDRHKAVNVAVAVLPQAVAGLEAGVSYYRDQPQLGGVQASEAILAGYVAYRTLGTEILVEGLRLRHAGNSVPTATNSRGFYAQVSHAVGRVRPFARYDRVRFSPADRFYAAYPDVNTPSVGVRFDPTEAFAVKVQLDRQLEPDASRRTVAAVQAAFQF